MSQHTVATGRRLIDGLIELGTALGYRSEPEWRLQAGTAAIDVAWLWRVGDDFPLVAFEVETTAGAGLANNALKVLGRSSSGIRKPLHLFHLIVHGGTRSGRPKDVATEFAGHNYSVHLLETEGEPRSLLENVLDVHSRVADRIDGIALGQVLARQPWPSSLLDDLLAYAEGLGFRGLSENCYARLARKDPAMFLPSLSRRLEALWHEELEQNVEPPNRYLEPDQPREEEYGSYMSSAAGEAIELGLLAALDPQLGPRAFEVLQRWQEFNHIGDGVGPFTGAGQQWTVYAVENLGYMWALVAVLMRDVPGARRWCAEQPAALLAELPETDAADVLLLAVWVMHLAATPDTADIYERARGRLRRAGGVSVAWLARPEPGSPGEDGDWSRVFGDERAAPTRQELALIMDHRATVARDPVTLGLDALLEDAALRPSDGAAVVDLLAA